VLLERNLISYFARNFSDFEAKIGQFPPIWPIGFFVPCIGALREAHFRRPRAKREKKKSAGAENTERPPERATFLYQILKSRVQPRSGKCFYARGEEDTEY